MNESKCSVPTNGRFPVFTMTKHTQNIISLIFVIFVLFFDYIPNIPEIGQLQINQENLMRFVLSS